MSHYVFEGRLRARICRECWATVSNARLKLYRHRRDQAAEELVAARSKETFRELSAEDIGGKESYLIGSATTGEDGSFRIELGDDQNYDGGAFEVDVELTTIEGSDPDKPRAPIQFTITSLQPDWQEQEDGQHAVWNHYIGSRYWCYILRFWDLWVICGRVVATGTSIGLDAMTVRAYDRDWLQDDLLGQDTTDAGGHFRIYYTSETFKKTPFSPAINLELTSGPDVYFQVEDSGGTVVIDEQPSQGRQPGRENVPRCFCETLEVGEEDPYWDPWFTHVGYFHILSDIDSTTGFANKTISLSPGSVGGAGWGFFDYPKLKGFCPKKRFGTSDDMFYRFLYVDPVTNAEVPVVGDLLVKQLVGSKIVSWDVNTDGTFTNTTQSIFVSGTGATPPVSGGSGPVPHHVIVPDAQGWIAVAQDALDGGFNGPLLRLNTRKIVPPEPATPAGAGNPPAPSPVVGKKVEIIFETTIDDGTGQPDMTAVVRQTDTVTLHVNNTAEVRQLDLQEFQSGSAGSCTGLTTTLTIKYTIDHELVRTWNLSMTSAASPWTAPSLPNGSASVATTHPAINVSTWPPCSYTVRLSSSRKLTDGELNDDGDTLPLTFCKT